MSTLTRILFYRTLLSKPYSTSTTTTVVRGGTSHYTTWLYIGGVTAVVSTLFYKVQYTICNDMPQDAHDNRLGNDVCYRTFSCWQLELNQATPLCKQFSFMFNFIFPLDNIVCSNQI